MPPAVEHQLLPLASLLGLEVMLPEPQSFQGLRWPPRKAFGLPSPWAGAH